MVSISVLIPVYNSKDLLFSCIESVLSQDTLPDEIIIFDDYPEKNSKNIVEKFNSELISYTINNKNLGRTKNYLSLLKAATSSFVLILDGDDKLLRNDFICDAKKNITKNNIVLFSGGCLNNYKDFKIKRNLVLESQQLIGFKYFLSWYSPKQTLPHSSTIFNRKLALSIGCYSNDVINTDIISQRLLLLEGEIYLSNKIYSQWNFTGDNASSIREVDDFISNLETILLPYNRAVKKGYGSFTLSTWLVKSILKYISGVCRVFIFSPFKLGLFLFKSLMILKNHR